MKKTKRKNNLIPTIILICAIVIIASLPLPIAQAANFTVSKSNISIENGKTSTITINAPTHTGRIDISTSDSNVATVSTSNLWVEENSKTITISAKSIGTATITIKGELYDSSTEEETEYTKTVKVTVTKAVSSESNNSSGTSNGNQSSGTTGGSTSNNNQSSNTGATTSGSQSSTSKPSTTSKPSSSNTTTSKPSSSSSIANIQNNIIENTLEPEPAPIIEENTGEEVMNENITQVEEVTEEVEMQESIIQEEVERAEINNVENSNRINFNGRIIMIVAIGVIAIIVMFIGIGVSKNIFKK